MTPVFQANYNEGMRRFPELFGRLNPESYKHIQIAKTADGAYCYISIKDGPQKAVALTDHLAPVKRAGDALNYNPRLQKELAPAVVVGLAPGIILDSVVKSFKDKQKLGHPFRPIYVIIDSLECLYAWLTACDRREILSHPDILFFWHEDLGKLVKLCESDINRSHLFIPISALPDQVSNKIIEPLAKFYLAREAQAKIWKSENDQYYNSMSDEELARIIAGKAGRKPRLLMPTHTSSTVIQYSTRDACAMFEKAGWETKIAKINWDFTLWRAAKEVNDFKPDMIIFINYLRSSFMDSIPENLLFVTWIQDTMSHLNQAKVAEEWNKNTVKPHCVTGIPKKRDFLIGYTDIVEPYGYLKERMIQLPMVVNTDIFHPRELTEEQKKKYGCDICFASNRGLPTEEMMKLEFLPPFTNKFLFDEKTCWQIHDELWKHYRAGNTLTGYPSLKNFLTVKVPTFLSCLEKNSPEDQELAIQRIFWILNDVIYRHIVLEWCDELGLKINLYGKGWEQHPRFKKYAKGIIAHGEELSIAYQAAKFCLHLNSIEGTHQRLNEIFMSGARPLLRKTCDKYSKALASALLFLQKEIHHGSLINADISKLESREEREALTSWFFEESIKANEYIRNNPSTDMDIEYILLAELIESPLPRMLKTENLTFFGKNELNKLLCGEFVPQPETQSSNPFYCILQKKLQMQLASGIKQNEAEGSNTIKRLIEAASIYSDLLSGKARVELANLPILLKGITFTESLEYILYNKIAIYGIGTKNDLLAEEECKIESLKSKIKDTMLLNTKNPLASWDDELRKIHKLRNYGFLEPEEIDIWERKVLNSLKSASTAQDFKAYKAFAEFHHCNMDYPAAMKMRAKVCESENSSPEERITLAIEYAFNDMTEKAEQLIDSIYASNPEQNDAYARIGRDIYMLEWDFEKACELFRKDEEKKHLSSDFFYTYLRILGAGDHLSEGLKFIQNHQVNQKSALLALSLGLRQGFHLTESLEILKPISETSISAKEAFISTLILAGDFNTAEELINKQCLNATKLIDEIIYQLAMNDDKIDYDALYKLISIDLKYGNSDYAIYKRAINCLLMLGRASEARALLEESWLKHPYQSGELTVFYCLWTASKKGNLPDLSPSEEKKTKQLLLNEISPGIALHAALYFALRGNSHASELMLKRLYCATPYLFMYKSAVTPNYLRLYGILNEKLGNTELANECFLNSGNAHLKNILAPLGKICIQTKNFISQPDFKMPGPVRSNNQKGT